MTTDALPFAPIALTMGEPAGIGGEIALTAWQRLRRSGPAFFIVADPGWLDAVARTINFGGPMVRIAQPAEAADAFPEAIPVLDLGRGVSYRPGQPETGNGGAVLRSIEMAVQLARSGAVSAIVTNPIQKATLYDAGFTFPGHTELLGHLAPRAGVAVMMLACPELRVVPVTVHQSLATAVADLTTDLIVAHAAVAAAALRDDFGLATPRLAVAGLNPHAGEGGAMGDEEMRIIVPAVMALRARGIQVTGPHPPDTLFTPRARPTYDAAICMYHDQGLIPLKALDIDGGVNVTLGLSIVRTSPDHGTALDLAGTGKANPGSLIAALHLAATIATHRATTAAQPIEAG